MSLSTPLSFSSFLNLDAPRALEPAPASQAKAMN
jgi:hypothetical protein